MPLTEREREQIEREEADAQRNPADAISQAVGQPIFAHNHRFPDMRAGAWSNVGGTAHGLAVSRFYFGATPQIVVDIVAQPERSRNEIRIKRAFCRERGIRYVVVADAYDDHGVREQLRAYREPAPAPAKDRRPARRQPATQKRPRTRRTAATT